MKHCLTFQAFSLRQREPGNLESLGISASLIGILIVSLATSTSPGHSQKLKKKRSPGQYHCWNNFTHFNSSQGSTDNEKTEISLLYYCLSSCLIAIHFRRLSFSFSFDHGWSTREISCSCHYLTNGEKDKNWGTNQVTASTKLRPRAFKNLAPFSHLICIFFTIQCSNISPFWRGRSSSNLILCSLILVILLLSYCQKAR